MSQTSPVKKKPAFAETNDGPNKSLQASYGSGTEDEIDLLDLVLVMLRRKRLILGLVLAAGLAAFIVTLLRSEAKLYRSEAIIVPQQSGIASFGPAGQGQLGLAQYSAGRSSSDKLLMMLESRGLTVKVIEKYHLKREIFPQLWDKTKKKWKGDPPSLHSACEALREMLKAEPMQTGGRGVPLSGRQMPISVSIRWDDPVKAKEFLDHYLNELSDTLRNEALRDAKEKKRFLEKQLETVIDPLMKEKIHTLRANEIEKETFANAQKYYGFTVMDPPSVPADMSAEKPNLLMNVVLAMAVAFIFGISLAFFLEYMYRVKTHDAQRYENFITELKTWRKTKREKR